MSDEPIDRPARVGGMALANGVLVHGPGHWAIAVRTEDGRIELASGAKRVRSAGVTSPLLRGVMRIVDSLAVVPTAARALPEARLPYRDSRTLVALLAGSAAGRVLRRSGLSPSQQEAVAAALSIVPIALALRGSEIAAYHGAEHMTIGSWEHGEPRPRVHERCGSHLVVPLLAATAAGNVVASRVARTPTGAKAGRLVASAAAMGIAFEVFGWMLRNPENPLARLLAWPGATLQREFLTSEPTPDQLAVAEAALEECLRLETASD